MQGVVLPRKAQQCCAPTNARSKGKSVFTDRGRYHTVWRSSGLANQLPQLFVVDTAANPSHVIESFSVEAFGSTVCVTCFAFGTGSIDQGQTAAGSSSGLTGASGGLRGWADRVSCR